MDTPIVGLLTVQQEPYPHLRDDSGTVLARDYEDERKTAFIIRAANSHAALVDTCKRLLEELRLIRMKDSGAVYDVTCRMDAERVLADLTA
jgi:hypothetical protein